MTLWVGIIGTLLGALVGGGLALLNARLSFRQQVARERQKLLLSKIEELYEVLSESRKAYEASVLRRVSSSLGVEESKQLESRAVPAARVQLLVNFYAPELLEQLSQIEKLRQEYSDVLGESVLFDNRDEETKKQKRGQLVTAHRKLDRAYADMQAEVVKLSKKYI